MKFGIFNWYLFLYLAFRWQHLLWYKFPCLRRSILAMLPLCLSAAAVIIAKKPSSFLGLLSIAATLVKFYGKCILPKRIYE